MMKPLGELRNKVSGWTSQKKPCRNGYTEKYLDDFPKNSSAGILLKIIIKNNLLL